MLSQPGDTVHTVHIQGEIPVPVGRMKIIYRVLIFVNPIVYIFSLTEVLVRGYFIGHEGLEDTHSFVTFFVSHNK